MPDPLASLGPRGHRALDFEFRLRCDPPLADWLLHALEPMADQHSSGPLIDVGTDDATGLWSAHLDGDPVFVGVHAHQVVHRLMVTLNHRIAASVRHLVLHGAVLADASRTIVAAGSSGSGKSTLAAVALQQGFRYGGDEHAAIGFDDRLVHPVPKPLGLKYGSAPRFRTVADRAMAAFFLNDLYVTPSELGAEVLVEPTAVHLYVLPHFEHGAAVSIRRLHPAEAMMSLRANAFNFVRAPKESFAVLATVARQLPVLDVRFGDAASALDAIRDYGA